jgi:hypothetical protein
VVGAVEHAEILLPRSDSVAVLVRQRARELVEVSEVVRGPGREMLA